MSPPILSGKKSYEKFRNASANSIIESASPSQSLRFAECHTGWAKQTWELVKPIILPIIPTDVCGANPTIRCPIRSSTENEL